MSRPPVAALIIFDGWGLRDARDSNAILAARTPTMNRLWQTQAHTAIEASGEAVGLAPGRHGQFRSRPSDDWRGPHHLPGRDAHLQGDRDRGLLSATRRSSARSTRPATSGARCISGDCSPTLVSTAISIICSPSSIWRPNRGSTISRSTLCSTGATSRRAQPSRSSIRSKANCANLAAAGSRRSPDATTRWIATNAGSVPNAPGAPG